MNAYTRPPVIPSTSAELAGVGKGIAMARKLAQRLAVESLDRGDFAAAKALGQLAIDLLGLDLSVAGDDLQADIQVPEEPTHA